MNKDKILNYCDELSKIDTEHIEQAKENSWLIKQERYRELNGCPSTFGLDEYVGLCETEGEVKDVYEQCERCWKKALGAD